MLAEVGLPVIDPEIPLAQIYVGSFGIVPTEVGHYADLIAELKA